MQTFGQKLAALRTAGNMTQHELAASLAKRYRNLNITRDQIAQWELDRNFPRHQAMFALCGFFGVTYDELMMPKKSVKKHLKAA